MGIVEVNPSQSAELFYCYARKDRALRDQLDIHLTGLRRSGLITSWYDGEIMAGIPWEAEIEAHLNTAHVILLLISPDFLYSDYCYGKEMARAIERHQAKEARVIPVLLRPVDWADTPFCMLQVLPSNAQPITSWPDCDAAFEDVAKGVRQVVNNLLFPNIAILDTLTSVAYKQLSSQALLYAEESSEKEALRFSLVRGGRWRFLERTRGKKVITATHKFNCELSGLMADFCQISWRRMAFQSVRRPNGEKSLQAHKMTRICKTVFDLLSSQRWQ